MNARSAGPQSLDELTLLSNKSECWNIGFRAGGYKLTPPPCGPAGAQHRFSRMSGASPR